MISIVDLLKLGRSGRGRPRGTGKRDEALLAGIADLMLAHPRMRLSTAIRRVLRPEHCRPQRSSVEHRLRRKWNAHKNTLMAQAKERRKVRMGYGRLSVVEQAEEALGLSYTMRALREAHSIGSIIEKTERDAAGAATRGLSIIDSIARAQRAAVGAATHEISLSASIEKAQRDAMGGATHELLRQAASVMAALQPSGAVDTAAEAVQRAVGSLQSTVYERAARATDMLYGSPYRRRSRPTRFSRTG